MIKKLNMTSLSLRILLCFLTLCSFTVLTAGVVHPFKIDDGIDDGAEPIAENEVIDIQFPKDTLLENRPQEVFDTARANSIKLDGDPVASNRLESPSNNNLALRFRGSRNTQVVRNNINLARSSIVNGDSLYARKCLDECQLILGSSTNAINLDMQVEYLVARGELSFLRGKFKTALDTFEQASRLAKDSLSLDKRSSILLKKFRSYSYIGLFKVRDYESLGEQDVEMAIEGILEILKSDEISNLNKTHGYLYLAEANWHLVEIRTQKKKKFDVFLKAAIESANLAVNMARKYEFIRSELIGKLLQAKIHNVTSNVLVFGENRWRRINDLDETEHEYKVINAIELLDSIIGNSMMRPFAAYDESLNLLRQILLNIASDNLRQCEGNCDDRQVNIFREHYDLFFGSSKIEFTGKQLVEVLSVEIKEANDSRKILEEDLVKNTDGFKIMSLLVLILLSGGGLFLYFWSSYKKERQAKKKQGDLERSLESFLDKANENAELKQKNLNLNRRVGLMGEEISFLKMDLSGRLVNQLLSIINGVEEDLLNPEIETSVLGARVNSRLQAAIQLHRQIGGNEFGNNIYLPDFFSKIEKIINEALDVRVSILVEDVGGEKKMIDHLVKDVATVILEGCFYLRDLGLSKARVEILSREDKLEFHFTSEHVRSKDRPNTHKSESLKKAREELKHRIGLYVEKYNDTSTLFNFKSTEDTLTFDFNLNY